MAATAHVGDIGLVFEVTIKDGTSAINISDATTKDLIFSRPDGTKVTVSAVFKTTGADGIIKYTTVSGDLSVAGTYGLQAHIIRPSGNWKTDKGRFPVDSNI